MTIWRVFFILGAVGEAPLLLLLLLLLLPPLLLMLLLTGGGVVGDLEVEDEGA